MKQTGQTRKIAIIGAGPAGITAAYILAKNKIPVDVYEAETQVGGIAKTIRLWNQYVDLGPHRFFSRDAQINKIWLGPAKKDYKVVNRLTRMYYRKKFFLYPVKLFDALDKLGPIEGIRSGLSYLKQKLAPTKQDGSFETYIINKFGSRLYKHFFKSYTEKLWGIPCKKLDDTFAKQRIKGASFTETLKNALKPTKGDKHKTWVEQFAYPVKGTGMVYERMAQEISKKGGDIFLDTSVKRVLIRSNKIQGLELQSGQVKTYDYVISSMPIDTLIKGFPKVPPKVQSALKKLTFRNTLLVYLRIDSTDLFPDQWVYIHEKKLKMGRITNFRNWVPTLYDKEKSTILVCEYWLDDKDTLWNANDKKIIELAKKELEKTGLVREEQIVDSKVVQLPKSYPVYTKGYQKHLKPIEAYLNSIEGLMSIGRYGSFKWNNQDHSILMGILAAQNIIEGKNENLWEINTDYEYQEKSTITESGLTEE